MEPFLKQLEKIVAGPAHPDNFYILSKYTHADIYAMAADFQQKYFSGEEQETVCLCVNDRAVMAAALLAALTRPVTLVIPYSFSETVLARVHQAHGFSKAIARSRTSLPRGVENIFPDHTDTGRHRLDASFVRNPDSVFVKLFTGGSTNTPRTWSKTVRNLFSEAIYQARKLNVSAGDRFAATVPAHHIYGLLFSVLTPLVASASVIDGEPAYPREIQNTISTGRADILVSIPIHYKMMAGMDFKKESLRCALSSAARLEEKDSRAFYKQTGLGITEIFGSTETGGIASRLCTDQQPHFTPFDCIDWKIVDGLLTIRSDFISPELPVDEEGFFVTSDRAEPVDSEGFKLRGRADRIVKVGGRRVDLDEIRSTVTGMPEVKDAAVISAPNGTGRENEIRVLAAAEATAGEIRNYLQHRLPGYAVPRRIRVVERIPVSATGKYESEEIKRLLENF